MNRLTSSSKFIVTYKWKNASHHTDIEAMTLNAVVSSVYTIDVGGIHTHVGRTHTHTHILCWSLLTQTSKLRNFKFPFQQAGPADRPDRADSIRRRGGFLS